MVDYNDTSLLQTVFDAIQNEYTVKSLINDVDKFGETPLWRYIAQKNDDLNSIKLMTNLMIKYGYYIDTICSNGQTIAHLIHSIYPIKNYELFGLYDNHIAISQYYHNFLIENNASLRIKDDTNKTPIDLFEINKLTKEKEIRDLEDERLLLMETQKIRQRLLNKNNNNNNNNDTKSDDDSDIDWNDLGTIDDKLHNWLSMFGLLEMFGKVFAYKKINYIELMNMNEDILYDILDKYCYDYDDELLQYFMECYSTEKTLLIQRENERKLKLQQKKENDEQNVEYVKLKCDKYVKKFLVDFGLNEIENIFAKDNVDMTRLAQLNDILIDKYIPGNTDHVKVLKAKLKHAIQQLRAEIAKEMEIKINKKLKELKKSKKSGHKCQFISDPVCLLIIGFGIFTIFTLFLFLVVGSESLQQKKSN